MKMCISPPNYRVWYATALIRFALFASYAHEICLGNFCQITVAMCATILSMKGHQFF